MKINHTPFPPGLWKPTRGCPSLPESREVEPIRPEHIAPAAQVEAEPTRGREIYEPRHP